ncbi:MAG TPA: thioredoxin family protein [Anaeromyxobacter sp.]|nr:thioredoxin family protein [Anaeromyxobacter sp.]
MSIYRCAGCGALNRMPFAGPGPQACSRCRRLIDTTGRVQRVDATALVSAIRASPAPVLVDFEGREADAPGVDGLARARAGELLVLRVDPGEEPAAAHAFGIEGVPTLVLFREGTEVARRRDLSASAELAAWVAGAAPEAAERP